MKTKPATPDLSAGEPTDPEATISGIQIIPDSSSAEGDAVGSGSSSGAIGHPSAETKAPTPTEAAAPAATSRAESFGSGELAMVCSRFPLGIIRRVRTYRRGSSKSPKVVLETDAGTVLVKRRAPTVGGQDRILFCHAVQRHLQDRGFPVARLMPMHGDGTALFLEGHAYEIFDFVSGKRYDRSIEATRHAGSTLAMLHRLLADFDPDLSTPAPTSCFHAIEGLTKRLSRLPNKLPKDGLAEIVPQLASAYDDAARHTRDAGFESWPKQVIHADWHPGNLVFQDRRVLAVLDFDTARRVPRSIDVANGALQFSVTRTGLDPLAWPIELDRERLGAFLTSYDSHDGCVLSKAELRALPWLMVQGLIAEAVIPILASGRFGSLRAGEFLPIVLKKADWIAQHAGDLTNCLTDPGSPS